MHANVHSPQNASNAAALNALQTYNPTLRPEGFVELRIVRRIMELSNDPRFDWSVSRPQLVTPEEMIMLCDNVYQDS